MHLRFTLYTHEGFSLLLGLNQYYFKCVCLVANGIWLLHTHLFPRYASSILQDDPQLAFDVEDDLDECFPPAFIMQ